MNLIRQRDDLKRARDHSCISTGQLEMALASPVFQWYAGQRDMTDDEKEWLFTNIMDEIVVTAGDNLDGSEPYKHPSDYDNRTRDGRKIAVVWPRITPYECFRITYLDYPIYEQWWVGKEKALCFRCDDRYSHKDVKMWTVHSTNRGSGWFKLWVWANEVKVDTTAEHKMAGRIELLANSDEMSAFASTPMHLLSFFLFDIMSNTSVVVRVRSEDPSKSVQWHNSREHYLVMHHKKAQSLQQNNKGPSDHDIVRGAHWRRAHLRRLSSDKFKHKRGLLVPVKKAWVGPEEWKGGDKKIYKIVTFEPKTLT